MQRVVPLLIGGVVLIAGVPAAAQVAPDVITGGGWYIIQNHLWPTVPATPGDRANFGWHGGVKHGDWWGNGNYVDHGMGLHVHSLFVSGYARVGTDGTDETGRKTGTRDVCGRARTNAFGDVWYRVRMKDAGESGRQDRFGISLYADDRVTLVYMSWGSLGDPTPGSGNIHLHKGNPSNSPPPPGTPNDCESLPNQFPFDGGVPI